LRDAAVRLSEVDPSSDAVQIAAQGEAATGDLAGAEALLARVLERGPDLALSSLAWRIALQRGDGPRAQEVLDQALARAVDRADKARLHRERAELEDKLGHGARAAVERAQAARLE